MWYWTAVTSCLFAISTGRVLHSKLPNGLFGTCAKEATSGHTLQRVDDDPEVGDLHYGSHTFYNKANLV